MRRFLVPVLLTLLLMAGRADAGWFFVTGPTGGGGSGTACGAAGFPGQVCNSTGGSGAVWGEEIVAPDALASSGGSAPDITIQGGAGDGVGTGSNVNITTGSGGATGLSGSLNVIASDAFPGSGLVGGSINFTAGSSDTATGGGISLVAGQTSTLQGGQVTIQGGDSSNGFGAGTGGGVSLISGNGAIGGNVVIGSPDAVGSVPNISSGIVTISTGNSKGTGISGGIILLGGSNPDTGDGGSIILQPGTGPNLNGDIFAAGHFVFGTTAIAPSACGSLPTQDISNNDNAGRVTVGSGTVTSCTLHFGRVWNPIFGVSTAPFCVANNAGPTPVAISVSAVSTTDVTFTFASNLNAAGGSFNYWCTN